MPTVTVVANAVCPEGATFTVETGENLARALVKHGVKLAHACEFNGACATCHVYVKQGYDSLAEPSDAEFDRLDIAFDSRPDSRLACQVKVGNADLVIEIPVHNRNIVGER